MRFVLMLMSALIISSCSQNNSEEKSSPEADLLVKISELETQVFNSAAVLNAPKAKELYTLYIGYADNHLSSDSSAEFLFKAGELMIGTEEYEKAIGIFDRLVTNYPEYEKSPQASYLQGFIYDEYLDKKGKAKERYEAMIDAYPRHPLANDARASIQLLGMSQEEILKMLEEKNKDGAKSLGSNSVELD